MLTDRPNNKPNGIRNREASSIGNNHAIMVQILSASRHGDRDCVDGVRMEAKKSFGSVELGLRSFSTMAYNDGHLFSRTEKLVGRVLFAGCRGFCTGFYVKGHFKFGRGH